MLVVKDLSLAYPGQKSLLKHLSFRLEQAHLLWLKGVNGCGKTSLLYSLCNIIPQHIRADRQGEVLLNGVRLNELPVNQLAPKLTMALNNPEWEFFFNSVTEEIIFALENLGLPEVEIETRLQKTLQTFSLTDKQDFPLHRLSAGWQKMASLAVQAAIEPNVLLLDEPLNGLSQSNQTAVLNWMQDFLDKGGILLVAEHSNVLHDLSPHILDLSDLPHGNQY
jgi:energy-coupling factor transporter ATP-binding protein EcfA2